MSKEDKSKGDKFFNKNYKKISELKDTLLNESGKTLKDVSDKSKNLISAGSRQTKELVTGKKNITQKVFNYADRTSKDIKGRYIDDISVIKSECNFLNRLSENKIPISVKHASLYGVAAAGIKINESELAALSRSIMDTDSSYIQKLINMAFGESEIKSINNWIDTVPGKDYAGGFAHRLEHGHDLEGLVELIKLHDIEGFFGWINHVWFRDFWTPHGVPYLPTGSESVYEWLCNIGLSKTEAADLLTINSMEVMAALFAYRSGKKLYEFILNEIKTKKARSSWERAIALENMGDYEAADSCFQDVISTHPDIPSIQLYYASEFLNRAINEKQNDLWYEHLSRCYDLALRARNRMKNDRWMPFQGGVLISFWGLASDLIVTSWSGKGENLNSIKGIINTGIDHFIQASNNLMSSKLGIHRPFSAVTNDLMALNLSLDTSFSTGSTYTPSYIRNRVVKTLSEIPQEYEEEFEYAEKLLNSLDVNYPLNAISR